MQEHDHHKELFSRPHLLLISLAGVMAPRRLRADWRQEWEAESRHGEILLADWDMLEWRGKLDLLRRALARSWTRCCYNQEDWRTKCFKTFVLACGCCSNNLPSP